jgi:hypothetical protein
MQKTILGLLLTILVFACKKDIKDTSISIVKEFQQGNTENIRDAFFSDEYFNALPNVDITIQKYPPIIGTLKIDKKENIIIETRKAQISNPHFTKDSVLIESAYVPLDVKMPSPVPSYMVELHYFEKKLVAFNLLDTKMNTPNANPLNVQNKIDIDKQTITHYNFMYEGGYKYPLIFKKESLFRNELGKNRAKFEQMIDLINEGKIIKAQKENDTKRFVGDPELDVIHLNLNNNYNWTIFSLKSEEPNKKENFPGAIELRYYEHLNIAVTYWIDTEDNELLKNIITDLCQLGENKRTKHKESIKLEIDR